ncbi:MAG: hypothetical protein ACTIKL_07885 [Canibacter sp.]
MTDTVERFDTWRQRHALIALAHSPAFLETAEGVAFVEQLKHFFVTSMRRFAWKHLQVEVEEHEIINLTLTGLLANDGRIARYAAAAEDNPWGYVSVCLRRWVRELTGIQGVDFEKVEEFVAAPCRDEDCALTPLDEVVEKSFLILAPVTPKQLHAALYRLLGWLAANPIQRLSYETHERDAAHEVVPELTAEQVTAVMNIAWGGRPRQAETSIMGALLIDPNFRVDGSSSHLRALMHYKAAIRAGACAASVAPNWK